MTEVRIRISVVNAITYKKEKKCYTEMEDFTLQGKHFSLPCVTVSETIW